MRHWECPNETKPFGKPVEWAGAGMVGAGDGVGAVWGLGWGMVSAGCDRLRWLPQ